MPSNDRRQYLTAVDLSMLNRILDHAGLPNTEDHAGHQRRGEAARLLIALFQQGVTVESNLSQALHDNKASSGTIVSRGYELARERFHAGPTPTTVTAGGYRYGRRVEKNGTWTIYHVFSGVPAEYASWKMEGLNVKTAGRALRILNTPAVARVAP